ncbi:hypothetical protein F4781DRAFT_255364 [Annulohypoxylon bovei var. microspora]|nr:hypothetical protein F4781DRAFT_255364 [Annulohypoxylon bovei var. microspora]
MQRKYYQEPEHVIGMAIVLPVIDIIVVGLRFRVRRLQKLPLKLDDWLMIPATLMTLCLGIDLVYGVSRQGLACYTKIPESTDYAFEVITDQLLLTFKLGYIFNLFFVLAIGSVKASILFFYLRIFSVGKGKVRTILITLITTVVLWTVSWLFESIFDCKLNFWDVQGPAKDLRTKCVDISVADLILCARTLGGLLCRGDFFRVIEI